MALVSLSSYEEDFARSVQLPKCNTEACDEKFAPCFNRGTNTYYCTACARAINRANPEMKLVETIDDPDVLMGMHELFQAGRQYVGTTTLEDHMALLSTGWGGSNPSAASIEVRRQLALAPAAKELGLSVRLLDAIGMTESAASDESMDYYDHDLPVTPDEEKFWQLVEAFATRHKRKAVKRKKAARARTGRRQC